ncbi:MAG: endolytic transglycosylase MltG [Flavobacteriales bacterium]
MKYRAFKIALAIILLIVATAGSYFVWVFHSNSIHVHSGEYWLIIREPVPASTLTTNEKFTLTQPLNWNLACRAKRLRTIKPGRYKLRSGMSYSDIIQELRSGGQLTVMVRIDDVESLEELAARLGTELLHDSAHFMSSFENDSLLNEIGIQKSELAASIRPNTYEFYWKMNAKTFLAKTKTESSRLWNTQRLQLAESLHLSPLEVVILASIVKAETGSIEEAPRIAGLYLNRLHIQMPLQSDPTAVFGKKSSTQRIYLSDLKIDSPYNTYLHKGLPPGPINFPEDSYIDAVLHAEKHTFLYMCAEPNGSGKHAFAQTLAAHEANRRNYIQWLNKKGIR